jgi:glycosyltransferase involved in cell wall biosynthesis
MAAGVPVVTTPVGGITELVVQDVNGLVVPVNDPGALAAAVARVLADAALRERLIVAGLRTAAELGLERTVNSLRELFERGPVTA